jgi:PAS domain S-box-containing protein
LGLVIPRLRLSRPALALALVGVFVGLTGFWIAARIDRARALSGLEADLKERAFSLDVQFTRAAAAVKETGAMLRVTPRLPRESFAALAADLHHDVACLMALEWVPRVSALEREAHEREARREGVEGYEIRERLPSGEVVRAATRPVYYPVRFVAPIEGNRPALGLDLGSDRTRAAVLERAARTGEPSLSGPVHLVQETGVSWGLLLVVPVRTAATPAAAQDVSGFAVGVVRVEDLVRSSLPASRGGGGESMGLELVDEDVNGQPVILFSNRAGEQAGEAQETSLREPLALGGQRWLLVGRPHRTALDGMSSGLALAAGAGAFLVYELFLALALSLRGRARGRVRHAEADLIRSVIQSMPEGVVVADTTGQLVVINDAARRMVGGGPNRVSPAEWSQAFGLFVPGTDRPFPSDELPLARAIRGEEVTETEVLVRHPRLRAETWVGATASPLRDRKGRLLGGVAVFRDLTEQKRTSELTERLSSAVEQTADSVFITDLGGVIEYVNPAFESTTGFSRTEAIGNTPKILRSGEQPPEFYASMWSTILGGDVFRGTVINRKKSGELFVSEQTITPMRDSRTGQLTHFVSVLRDLTDRLKLTENAIEQRLAGLVQKRLFPRTPPRLPGLEIAGVFAPAQDTCGDYYDFISLPDGKLMFVVADVCGHGMGAALIMAETRAYLRSLARTGMQIQSIVAELNRLLLEDLEAPCFVTMMLGTLDARSGDLMWANMGHPKGLLLDATGALRATLDSTCRPLGLFMDIGCLLGKPITLDPDDLLLVTTDGVLEATALDGTEFGLGAMLDVVRANLKAPAETVAQRVVEAALAHASGQPQLDDVTAVFIRRNLAGTGPGDLTF